MARPRKPWKWAHGPYGTRVGMREPRPGAPLRWDYRDPETRKRVRPEVFPRMYVRRSPDADVDPTLVRAAKELIQQRQAELTLAPRPNPAPRVVSRGVSAEDLTVPKAFALYHDPKRNALPKSREARNHHLASREFWELELAETPLWNDVPPADVRGALRRLVDVGKVATAEKRLANLRTLTKWLQREMKVRGLDDPTLGISAKQLKEGYKPRRPRLTHAQTQSLRRILPSLTWRTRLFYTLMIPSGTRAIQARTAMRSGLDAPLEPPPPADHAPYGWIALRQVKGQSEHVFYLTLRQRLEIVRAISRQWDGEQWVDGPLAEWERRYQAGEISDYPLLPGGRIDRGEMTIESSVSDRQLRYELDGVFEAAGIKRTERMAFHAVRRAWTDLMHEKEGLDTTASAGGWSSREMVDEVYLSSVRHAHLERARRVQEAEEQGD